ncbi:hypothetical protein CLAFUW4_02726 [Fulvia fulva]|uniref:Uncharacterized protein n=1 Tax=Passalora fulva TaxID=5499 RepID=A0A9Q8LAR2_PASFU|nr:uncharacterized protein CLAFUR5_02714 [Fulvia fulva]KAK4630908.1 hypothetical protein CLAFUR4_02721 [Fulvia fulva]KAK4633021.1 hypothetical protein CLAFUR0_02723 [Fulvia fulva]UJO13987.1 hypothetical protein CLAFUR5_02714 [Fulvia fulva]WPV10467.1 hypothetical protein CLAFUW4_02726 [Fulvia fulva]WPV25969.1 hypothetical protein CLAFUW7_02725 [Fulvia fulva]
MGITMKAQKRPHASTDTDEEVEMPSKKHRPVSTNPRPVYYPSFYTTICIYSSEGVAIINKVCLDIGFSASGPVGHINPSTVEKCKLEKYQHKAAVRVASGDLYTTLYCVKVPLTFETATGNITVPDVELRVNLHDCSSDQILLETGVLHLLGGVHDHRTNPPSFQVTDPETESLVLLESCSERDKNHTDVIWKTDQNLYLNHIFQQPGFVQFGTKLALPDVALEAVATSMELLDFNPNAPQMIQKFQVRKDQAYEHFFPLWQAVYVWALKEDFVVEVDELVEAGVKGAELEEARERLTKEKHQRLREWMMKYENRSGLSNVLRESGERSDRGQEKGDTQ